MPGNPCSVAICRNNTRPKGTRFFSFPKDDNIREQWIMRCFSNKPMNHRKMLICSKHFKPDDFEDEMQARLMGTLPRRLKRTAVPTLHILPPGAMQILYAQIPQNKKIDERIPKPSQEKRKDYQHPQKDTKKNKYFATELNINMESFIYEIRQRPEIWDVSSNNYLNREKKKAWDELIDIFINKKKPSVYEKEHFGQQLQSRWQSVQDTYSRDLKIQKRFGSKKKPVSKFFHRLSFLEDIIGSQETTNTSTKTEDLSLNSSIFLML